MADRSTAPAHPGMNYDTAHVPGFPREEKMREKRSLDALSSPAKKLELQCFDD